jgi:antitoxin HicB
MKYPAQFLPDTSGFVVTFRDIPEAMTQGDDEADAVAMAKDVLVSSMDYYLERRRAIPLPSVALPGERLIPVPASVATKILLLNEMLVQEVTPSELARRMGTTRQEVNRLTDLAHATKIDRIEDAMSALGRKFEITVIAEAA